MTCLAHGESTEVIRYLGCSLDQPGGGRLVIVEVDGECVGLLPHRVKHSPTGMMWGYAGSGPADLARSLLIHALGESARCFACGGGGGVGGGGSECGWCDGGWVVLSSTYQQFKFDVVADLPERWALSRADVLSWLGRYSGGGWS